MSDHSEGAAQTAKPVAPSIRAMQEINAARSARWMAGTPGWTTLEIAGELAGEVGELANICKKLRRSELGVPGNKVSDNALLDQARGEVADVMIVLMLTASKLGIDVEDAVIETFNAKSAERGFPERFDHAATCSCAVLREDHRAFALALGCDPDTVKPGELTEAACALYREMKQEADARLDHAKGLAAQAKRIEELEEDCAQRHDAYAELFNKALAFEARIAALTRGLEEIAERSSYGIDPRDAFEDALQRARSALSASASPPAFIETDDAFAGYDRAPTQAPEVGR